MPGAQVARSSHAVSPRAAPPQARLHPRYRASVPARGTGHPHRDSMAAPHQPGGSHDAQGGRLPDGQRRRLGQLVPLAGGAGAGAGTGLPARARRAAASTRRAAAALWALALRRALSSVRTCGEDLRARGDPPAIRTFCGWPLPGGEPSGAGLGGRPAPRYQDADHGHAGREQQPRHHDQQIATRHYVSCRQFYCRCAHSIRPRRAGHAATVAVVWMSAGRARYARQMPQTGH